VPPQTRRAAAVVVFNLAKEVEKVRANALGPHTTLGHWMRSLANFILCRVASFQDAEPGLHLSVILPLHAVTEAHTALNTV
jgi:hypothetical protein